MCLCLSVCVCMFVDRADSYVLMDVKIAGYLLSPEDPPNSLETLMQRFGTEGAVDKVKERDREDIEM